MDTGRTFNNGWKAIIAFTFGATIALVIDRLFGIDDYEKLRESYKRSHPLPTDHFAA